VQKQNKIQRFTDQLDSIDLSLTDVEKMIERVSRKLKSASQEMRPVPKDQPMRGFYENRLEKKITAN